MEISTIKILINRLSEKEVRKLLLDIVVEAYDDQNGYSEDFEERLAELISTNTVGE